MRSIILIACLLFTTHLLAQHQNAVDSIAAQICIDLKNNAEPDDSTRVFQSFSRHLTPFVSELDEEAAMEFANNVFFRLQKNCELFWDILKRNSPPTENWEEISSIPESRMTAGEYMDFRKISSFHYLEYNGDTVSVSAKNSFWQEKFADNSFSRLNMKWLNDSTFELSFIKSDNAIRKNLSHPGDKYIYSLIEKGEGYFLICVSIPGQDRLSLFKLLYKE